VAKKSARKRVSAAGEEGGDKDSSARDRIANLLAIIATRDMDKDDAALKLDAIGFSPTEVASLLDVNTNYVQVARFRKRNVSRKALKKRR
jgi:DNA-directed RNA polymerase specialized sigma24 family protein